MKLQQFNLILILKNLLKCFQSLKSKWSTEVMLSFIYWLSQFFVSSVREVANCERLQTVGTHTLSLIGRDGLITNFRRRYRVIAYYQMVGNDPPAGGSVIAESFWLPLFLVVVILTLSNDRVGRFLGDSKLHTGPHISFSSRSNSISRSVEAYFILLPDAERTNCKGDHLRKGTSFLDQFYFLICFLYSFIVIICFIIRKLIDTLLTQFHDDIQDDFITTRILKVPG